MQFEVGIKPHDSRSDIFFSIARACEGGKMYGFAEFWRECTHTPYRWGARVDVKDHHNIRGNGIATAILQAGDAHIRTSYPGELRLFQDLNAYSYLVYTSLIADEQIVDFTEDGLIFYP